MYTEDLKEWEEYVKENYPEYYNYSDEDWKKWEEYRDKNTVRA